MANIDIQLQRIMDAVYGEEVRGSIHDALAAMNTESSNAMEYAATAKDSAQAAANTAEYAANDAQQRAQEAFEYASAAKDAEDSAKASEESCVHSALSAEQNAIDTAAAKHAAEEAKTIAVESMQSAKNYRENAEIFAQQAETYANSAMQYSGKAPKPDSTTKTWWVWDADTAQYIDTHIGSEIEGPRGVGVEEIRLTEGNHSPGTTDLYTLKMSDNSIYNLPVYNGRNGDGVGDVLGISFDLILPNSSWNNDECVVSDAHLIANERYQYFISADEACHDLFLASEVRAKDVTTTGFLSFVCQKIPTHDLIVRVIRLEFTNSS